MQGHLNIKFTYTPKINLFSDRLSTLFTPQDDWVLFKAWLI